MRDHDHQGKLTIDIDTAGLNCLLKARGPGGRAGNARKSADPARQRAVAQLEPRGKGLQAAGEYGNGCIGHY